MEKIRRFEALDGLRAIFGLGIVFYHINKMFDLESYNILAPVCEYGGYFGNYIFFILSGFLISCSYKERLRNGTCEFREYMGRRLKRLYPIYFLSNLAIIFSGTVALSPQRTLATFLMISTGWFFNGDTPYNLPSWFLCVLLICYLLYYLIGRLSARFPKVYPILCLTLTLGGAALEKLDWSIFFLFRVCGEGYMNFFLGVLLAEIPSLQTSHISAGKRAKLHTACGLILCVIVFLSAAMGFRNLPGDMRWWITLICACLVAISLLDGLPAKVLSLPGLSILGKRSFSLLLWHVPLARYWGRAIGQRLDIRVSFILYFILLVALSFWSYFYLEHLTWLNAGKKRCHTIFF